MSTKTLFAFKDSRGTVPMLIGKESGCFTYASIGPSMQNITLKEAQEILRQSECHEYKSPKDFNMSFDEMIKHHFDGLFESYVRINPMYISRIGGKFIIKQIRIIE